MSHPAKVQIGDSSLRNVNVHFMSHVCTRSFHMLSAGPIPSSLGNVHHLKSLFLSKNSLTGESKSKAVRYLILPWFLSLEGKTVSREVPPWVPTIDPLLFNARTSNGFRISLACALLNVVHWMIVLMPHVN